MEIERENRTKGTSGGERCRKFDGNFWSSKREEEQRILSLIYNLDQ
jgi:hypothetical protein